MNGKLITLRRDGEGAAKNGLHETEMPGAGQVDGAAAGDFVSHTNHLPFILKYQRFLSRGLQQSGLVSDSGDVRGKMREERMEKRSPCRRFLPSGRTLRPGTPGGTQCGPAPPSRFLM